MLTFDMYFYLFNFQFSTFIKILLQILKNL